ncbi:putative nitrogen regulatory PII-like protein [Selenomonas ruminantium subsp. lactilytica TAM6421]|uniref:Putative nitrogen regulatory PII-like protein n=1 Tax=Selenomonas ruminantium subsp. lactilytica (strain NBRC 103574 / TAM6421) TaxID=927704 RepID=I0GTR8_SELRL|nr:putative nitrogen regulatory PII-like protein [Selenomonas ruminantium subsp. lactilytica TAM6421]
MSAMLTKIEIITRSSKLDDLLRALNKIGVLGLTVSQVFGCGLQKGHQEVYRGKKYDVNLTPKIKVETVVSEVPVDLVLETCERVLRTGKFGDGKIFVSELKDAVRIRTGQRGDDAIRDIPGEVKEQASA